MGILWVCTKHLRDVIGTEALEFTTVFLNLNAELFLSITKSGD